jgi:hypothetical protein
MPRRTQPSNVGSEPQPQYSAAWRLLKPRGITAAPSAPTAPATTYCVREMKPLRKPVPPTIRSMIVHLWHRIELFQNPDTERALVTCDPIELADSVA